MELILALNKLKILLTKARKDQYFSHKLDEFETYLNTIENADDTTISQLLYGKSNLTKTFLSLKYRMEERLMNDVFKLSSDEENLKTRINANIVVDKMMFIGSLFQKNFFRKEAIILYEKCFSLAVKFNFFNQALQAGQALSNHYGFVEVNEKKMNYFLEKNKEFSEILAAENYIKECNTIISNLYVTNKGGLNISQLNLIEVMVQKMTDFKSKYKTNTIVNLTNDLTFFYFQSIGDHTTALNLAISTLEENSGNNNYDLRGLFQSKMNIATSYFNLKNYSQADIWFKESIALPTKGTRNWFFANSLFFLNVVLQKQYNDMLHLTLEVISDKNLSKYPYFQEQWAIREAFMHFLIRAGKIDITEEDRKSLKPFVLSKFLNSVPFNAKDKSGQNITIIVLQILFLLSDKKFDQIIDRIDALTQYSYRYLRNDDTLRSNCFIKMLLQMISANFHPIRTKTYTEDLRKKLDKSHLNTDEKSTQVEIIPYDYLWDVILEILEKNK